MQTVKRKLFESDRYPIVTFKEAKRIFLVDVSNIGWRAWNAKAYSFMSFGGKKSGHIFGFMRILLAFLKNKMTDTSIVFCLDGRDGNWRREMFPEYKGNRGGREDSDPMPDITELATMLPGYVMHHGLAEADDCIATFAVKHRAFERKHGLDTSDIFILSEDRDLWQLMQYNRVFAWGQVKEKPVSVEDVAESYHGLDCSRIHLFKAFFGDPSDGIPGVRGLHKKHIVAALLQIQHIDEFWGMKTVPEKVMSMCVQNRELVERNWILTTLHKNIPTKPVKNKFDRALLEDFLVKKFGCKSMQPDIEKFFW